MKKLAVALVLAAAAANAASKTVTVKGSDTMVILGQRWAETYMAKKKDVVIQVTGGGSGTGIAALVNGSTSIAQASRPMKDKEKQQVKEKQGKDVTEIPVALDGLAIYVHASNPIQKITLAQAKAVYTGEIADWQELGGKPGPIVMYSRENNSGTYVYFKEHVLENEDFAAEVLNLPGTAAVINAVGKDPKAIGYGGIAYSKGTKPLKVAQDDKSEAYEPTMENVAKNVYPISRSLYFYVAGAPEGETKAFIDYVLSPEGQKLCEQVGYYPLRSETKKSKEKPASKS